MRSFIVHYVGGGIYAGYRYDISGSSELTVRNHIEESDNIVLALEQVDYDELRIVDVIRQTPGRGWENEIGELLICDYRDERI